MTLPGRRSRGSQGYAVLGGDAFIPVLDKPGVRVRGGQIDRKATLYVRTHWCVVVVPCSCGAKRGELCFGRHGRTLVTHVDRRQAARGCKPEPGERWHRTVATFTGAR